jgi:uncharacterized protein YxeA
MFKAQLLFIILVVVVLIFLGYFTYKKLEYQELKPLILKREEVRKQIYLANRKTFFETDSLVENFFLKERGSLDRKKLHEEALKHEMEVLKKITNSTTNKETDSMEPTDSEPWKVRI